MNESQSDHEAGTEKSVQHTIVHIAAKLAPLGLAALFSFTGSTAVDFFADLNRRVERLDHNCPITEQRLKVVEQNVIELRAGFAAYPRDYEVQRAVQGHAELMEYATKDRVLVERLVNDMGELQTEFWKLLREHNVQHRTN